jgi:hypothetical protein
VKRSVDTEQLVGIIRARSTRRTCPGRRYTPCLPVIRQPFRSDAALTHGSQQVNAMGIWS